MSEGRVSKVPNSRSIPGRDQCFCEFWGFEEKKVVGTTSRGGIRAERAPIGARGWGGGSNRTNPSPKND